MQISINDKVYEVPFDLSQITLMQFIAYQEKYGRDLGEKFNYIFQKEFACPADEIEIRRQIELDKQVDIESLCWYSFWTGFDLQEAKHHPSLLALMEQYRVLRSLLYDKPDRNIISLPCEFEWKGEQWTISDFMTNQPAEMSFNEIMTTKKIQRYVQALGENKWDAMRYLCCVYCRKKGELFTEELGLDGSERMNELKELPLTYALSIAYYLSLATDIWQKIVQSSN